ncbi:hypothetical protein DSLASN_22410 [Desulfoluna limicola]|uniref:Uncharacterized protein n=1 Tax=Desulfoluna limicola TaxID=2810562 RepID=A0ABM7PH43_9BACT|nr:hypothetical protein DSLASN_22410 [Desulfoluna limicola]
MIFWAPEPSTWAAAPWLSDAGHDHIRQPTDIFRCARCIPYLGAFDSIARRNLLELKAGIDYTFHFFRPSVPPCIDGIIGVACGVRGAF